MEDSPFELCISTVQLISAIKAGGRRKESNIGDINYPAYFKTKRSKAIYIYMSVFRRDQAKGLVSSTCMLKVKKYAHYILFSIIS